MRAISSPDSPSISEEHEGAASLLAQLAQHRVQEAPILLALQRRRRRAASVRRSSGSSRRRLVKMCAPSCAAENRAPAAA